MKVLIANDELMQLKVLSVLFEKNGFSVVTALNGHEAFLKVQDSFDSPDLANMFDLLILDLNMPISNGYDACKKINNLFTQKKKTNYLQHKRIPMKRHSSTSAAKSNAASMSETFLQKQNHICMEDGDLIPLIIALTSHIDSDVLSRTDEAGFMMSMLSPLKEKDIQRDIQPLLDERLWKFTRKVRLIEFYESNVSLRQYLKNESLRSPTLSHQKQSFRLSSS